MAHSFRFFAESVSETHWQIAGDEAHHLHKVVRLGVGDRVEVMDGKGGVADGVIEDIASGFVNVRVTNKVQNPQPEVPMAIALGVLKYGDIDDLLPMLTEFGIDQVHIFGQVGVAKDRLSEKVQARWQKIIRQACKQAKRPWLPEIVVHSDVSSLLAATGGMSRVVLDPDADELVGGAMLRGEGGPVLLIVGGEKGFSAEEQAILGASNVLRGRIGSYVLRAVTAAYAAAVNLAMYRDGVTVKS